MISRIIQTEVNVIRKPNPIIVLLYIFKIVILRCKQSVAV